MQVPSYAVFIVLFATGLVFFNSLISKDIYEWTPSLRKQIVLYLLVWLVPVLGFVLANNIGNLGWFKKRSTKNSGSVISSGFLEMDSVFNPGVRHTIEMIDKKDTELRQENKQADDENKNLN